MRREAGPEQRQHPPPDARICGGEVSLIFLANVSDAQDGPLLDHSALAPENLTTLAHFSVSSAMSLPKSVGEPGSTVPPRSSSRPLILGSARAALISLLSFSMISAGVFFGTPTPNHE